MTSGPCFMAFKPFSDILQLRYPQIKDTGIYECQISTTPPRGYPVYLSVVGELKEHIYMLTR